MIGSETKFRVNAKGVTREDRERNREGLDRKITSRKKRKRTGVCGNAVTDCFGINNTLNWVRHDSDKIRTL
jgi:hypothetical protein